MSTFKAKEPYHEELNNYLQVVGDSIELDEMNMDVLFYLNKNISNGFYDHFTASLPLFEKKYGPKEVQNKLQQDGARAYKIALQKLDEPALEEAKKFNYKYNPYNAEKEALKISIAFYGKTKEWDKYTVLAERYIDSFLKVNGISRFEEIELYNIVAEFDLNVTDQEYLVKAANWCGEILAKRQEAYIYETKASILHKLGDKKGAISACKKAISTAIANGDDPASAKSLLKVVSN